MQTRKKFSDIKVRANGMTRLLVNIPVATRSMMGLASARLGLSQQQIVRDSLNSYLAANAEPEAPKPKRSRKPVDIATEDIRETYEQPAKVRKTRTRKGGAK